MSTYPKSRIEGLPHWPRWLNKTDAAAYLGITPEVFVREVNAGLWPPGFARSSKHHRWDRRELDEASDSLPDTVRMTSKSKSDLTQDSTTTENDGNDAPLLEQAESFGNYQG